ncbi:5-formyltetrahydrofolate cyclo-ligase [Saccharomonospora iraqiensis]|uniref:5-formyltetrahydrofolate cyclo-ligase n=1 Tax=Saccharomonospora iraqiensis TaxID=52698 RepID=UPI0003FCCC0A|nr:5-formyltetrahydrofolate cyclo-ligase [Saccharomonospora iraqiensis]
MDDEHRRGGPAGDRAGVGAAKHGVRRRVWERLDELRVTRFPGAYGRIPNFVDAERAAAALAQVPEWAAARVVKVNPDAPQLPVRSRVLAQGRVLVMPAPRLAAEEPFVVLDGASLEEAPRRAAAKERVLELGTPAGVAELPHVDLVVCGTVAVNRAGVRVGKGGGFSDIEYGLLADVGLVDERTVVATTVHGAQVLDEELPETAHDFRVDLVVTPDEVIRTPERRRSPGILWQDLTEDTIASIPALARRRP